MKSLIEFTVRGDTLPALQEAARDVYREVMGNPEALLPWTTVMSISPEAVTMTGSGEQTIQGWEAHVTVQENQK